MVAGSGPRRRSGSIRPLGRAPDAKSFAAGVGEAVRRARQTRGWTQAELAERAGLSPNYVARLERGELGPSLLVAHMLCATLDIEVAELLQAPSGRSTRRRALG
jgi:HTH-type transcriptional regulator/antitoxin HipB